MNANFASFLYLVSGILFILALRGLSHPTTSRQGNMFGMIGMGIAILTTLALATPSLRRLLADRARPGDRRQRRRRHRAAHPDDLDAAACRGVPFAGRPRRRHGRGGGDVCAGKLRHRHGRRHPWPGAHRDEPWRRHRRRHLHRVGHRLPEARRPHVRQADHAADAPCRERRARHRARGAHHPSGHDRKLPGLLADRCRVAGAWRAAHHPDRRRRHAGRGVDAEFLFRLGGGRARLHARQPRA